LKALRVLLVNKGFKTSLSYVKQRLPMFGTLHQFAAFAPGQALSVIMLHTRSVPLSVKSLRCIKTCLIGQLFALCRKPCPNGPAYKTKRS
jgi:hypothetical protein